MPNQSTCFEVGLQFTCLIWEITLGKSRFSLYDSLCGLKKHLALDGHYFGILRNLV